MDGARPGGLTREHVTEEGRRLAAAVRESDLGLRIMGGVAVYLRCPSASLHQLARSYGDVDFIGLSRDRARITDFFEANGYAQDRMFNALHGGQRLNFTDPVRDRPIDVVLDVFAMCHTIDLRDRLTLEPVTIPLTDLLLTKLQVVALNDKDVRDLLAMLADHDLGSEPGDAFDGERLQSMLGDDWGFEHTVRCNLARVVERAASYSLPADTEAVIRDRAARIVALLDAGPKSLRWRMRSAVGTRMRWYQVPEEARR